MTRVYLCSGGVALLPDPPKCLDCGHEMCPMCRAWCDSMNDSEDEGDAFCPCADTLCRYATGDAETWLALLDALPPYKGVTTGIPTTGKHV